MNNAILKTIYEFDVAQYEPIYVRSLDFGEPLEPKAGNLVRVITGMRRSGKSYRLFQEMRTLHDKGIPWERILYFNFEDDRLAPITTQVGDEVLNAFFSIHPESEKEGCYFFFDELQEMENWGAWLRRVVDTYKATIYVSGSSSKMLSSEIATEFRGRAIDFELTPYSFAEYLAVKGKPLTHALDLPFSSGERSGMEIELDEYLQTGGFPAVQDLPRLQALSLLQSYVERVVARDVVERHNIAKPRVASLFAQRCLGLNGRQISIRKIENDLRSVGIATSRELLGDLLAYFEEAYLLFTVKELTYSLSESTTAQSKIYAIDPGLALASGKARANDRGQRLENAVYLELRRRNFGKRRDAIASLRTKSHGYEVDFVVGDVLVGETSELIQVCDDVDNPDTLERELRALREALIERQMNEATLIVGTGEDAVYEFEGKRIEQIPAWKWMLNPGGYKE